MKCCTQAWLRCRSSEGWGEHSTFEGGTDYCALSNTVSRFREGSTAAESLFSAGFNGGSPPNPNLPIYQPVTEAK